MWEVVLAFGVPLLKFIMEKYIGKKLSDKEFFDYLEGFQKRKDRAGKVTAEWEEKLKKAQEKLNP